MNVGVNSARLNLRLEGWRSRLLLMVLVGSFAGLVGRAAWLQGFHAGFLQQNEIYGVYSHLSFPGH